MINQRLSSCSETMTDATVQLETQTTNEALDNFLTYPSFSTKQMALEMLWKQISQSSATAIMQKSRSS
ncbi:MAG: hypothetical protein H6R01_1979 [Burkholderiaceae bacterium]|nr:hypothetical protein [Burkholderiaceae bacterium]